MMFEQSPCCDCSVATKYNVTGAGAAETLIMEGVHTVNYIDSPRPTLYPHTSIHTEHLYTLFLAEIGAIYLDIFLL